MGSELSANDFHLTGTFVQEAAVINKSSPVPFAHARTPPRKTTASPSCAMILPTFFYPKSPVREGSIYFSWKAVQSVTSHGDSAAEKVRRDQHFAPVHPLRSNEQQFPLPLNLDSSDPPFFILINSPNGLTFRKPPLP